MALWDEPAPIDRKIELHRHAAAADVMVNRDHHLERPHLETSFPEPDVLLDHDYV